MPLPISCEVNRRSALHCERRDGVNFITIRHAAVVLTPGSLLRTGADKRQRYDGGVRFPLGA
jgi:hypothetical protein